MSMFKKAVKSEAKLRLAIAGPSGSGKTYTALSVAAALADGRPVALVDTEHGSASKYADIFGFDVAEMHPPFHPDKVIQAINEAARAGYAVIILDSLSHAWEGTGGVLDLVDEAAKRIKSGNTYMAWKEGTPVQNRLYDAITGADIHVIATERSKTEYVLVANNNGKQEPKKVGMKPQQREGFEYEFDVFLEMDIDHNGIVSKTRCPALTDRVFAKPGRDLAAILADWLQGAPPADNQPARVPDLQKPAAQPAHRNGSNGASPLPAGVPGFVADWQAPTDAYAWAVQESACQNSEEARADFKAIVSNQPGARLTTANMLAVFVDFYHAQSAKLSALHAAHDDPFADDEPAEVDA